MTFDTAWRISIKNLLFSGVVAHTINHNFWEAVSDSSYKFKASLICGANSRIAQATQRNKIKQNQTIIFFKN